MDQQSNKETNRTKNITSLSKVVRIA